jgi:hypothetical protein
MRPYASPANSSISSFSKIFDRVLLLSALLVAAGLNSFAQDITVSLASLKFASQVIDTTSTAQSVTITNGGASAQVVDIVMGGDFTETDNCAGNIAAGSSCTAKISFTPSLVGSISGAASIYDGSHNLLAFVGLSGTGDAPVTTSPASLSFKAGTIGTLSAAQTFKITNNFSGSVNVTAITASSDYVINTGTCLTTPLAKGKYCTVSVQVLPTSATDDGAIIVTDNAPNGLPLVVKLSSAATGGPTTPISLSKTSLTFKELTGGTSASQTITVTNTSASAVTLGTTSASGDYAIVSNTCTGSLAAGKTCTFGITFNPTFVGTIEGSAAIAYTGNNSPQLVDLTGTSEAPLTVSPTKLTFTAQGMGTTSTAQKLTITNNSASAVTLSSIVPSADFQIQTSGTTCSLTGGTLAAGKTCAIEVQFEPTIDGSVVGAVTLTNNASPDPLLIALAGTGSATNALLNGNYAIMLNGWSSATTAASVVGSFVADGAGNITEGLLDVADQSSSGPKSGTFTGTYSVGSNNLATINLTYAGGLSGSDTFEAALDASDGNGHSIFYDSGNRKASGLLRKQEPGAFSTGKFKGNYAFEYVGGGHFALAGQFNSNGSGGLSGVYDANDGGTLESDQPFTSSDFTVASTGRGTLTVTTSSGNLNYVFYVVSSSEALVMAVDTETPPAILAGRVLQQSGTFTNASLNGISVYETEALDAGTTPATPIAIVGLVTTTGSKGTFTLTDDVNDGGTVGTGSDSGTYSVASNGRVTVTGEGSHEPVLYLIGPNQAFVIGTDSKVAFGTMTPQTGSKFTNASLSGNYMGGSQPPESANVSENVNSGSLNDGTLTATADRNGSGGTSSRSVSGTYAVSSNGRVVVTFSDGTTDVVYIISASQFVDLPGASSTNPALTDFHQ